MGGPSYGVSGHYLDAKGRSYLAWQDAGGATNGRLEARKFAGLVRPEHAVLDFGCGAGNILRALTCARKIGVEVNPAARERCEQAGITCFADVAEVPDGIVDVAISPDWSATSSEPDPFRMFACTATGMKPFAQT